MSDQQQKLLPIGTRVTHWDGAPNTWGKGTIVAYNQVEPCSYLQTNFTEAIQMANEAGLLGGILGMVYDRTRCPYVVQWDIRVGDTDFDKEKREKYPRGYRDVYEHDSVRAYPTEETPMNIFPNDWVRVMGRQWREKENRWGPWLITPEELYLERKDNETVKQDWQFCVRPLPEPKRRYGPEDGSFVPLTLVEGATKCDPAGYEPPLGIFVEYYIHRELEPKYGMTAQLQAMGPWSRCETVFVALGEDNDEVHFIKDVSQWRELIDRKLFTPKLLQYVEEHNDVFNRSTIAKE